MAAPQNFVSVSRRPPDVEDYIDILRRYRSWIIGPTFAGMVASVVLAYSLPDVYVCRAAMQIRPSAVSNTLLSSAMTSQMAQRLQELKMEILGRDNLIALMPKLNLYPKERAKLSAEDVEEEYFRKDVSIGPYDSAGAAAGAQAFNIVFKYPDKNKARTLVAELVNEFQSKDEVLQTANASQTGIFFKDLVTAARENMEKKQLELANFTSENQGRLPENFQANYMEVTTKQAAINSLHQQISQEEQRRALLESNLNNNKNLQSDAESNLTTAINTPNQQVKNQNLTMIEQAIATRKAECAGLGRRYLPDYPDVLTCNDQVKSLEDRKVEIEKADTAVAQPGSTTRMVTNPAAQQQLNNLKSDENNIMGQIHASVLQVGVLEKQLAEQTKELKEVEDKINASPQVIQKFNQLVGDLQMLKDEYTNLSAKQSGARTEQSLEEHRAGETLDILENAITPEKPASPVRGAIVGIGTLIGLVVGVALAGAKEVKNTSLKNLKDVRAYTNLPVLSSIPLLENALLVRRKRRLAWLAWSSALIVGTMLMTGAMYYYYVIATQA
jgi:uncharacterized protein involved in exopolysaccharide biosynthesis